MAAVPLLLLEAALVVAWSSGFVGVRLSLDHAPVFLVIFWRFVTVVAVLLPWALPALRRASPRTLLRQAGVGLLATAGYLAGVAQGIALGVPAGLAALIADLLPLGVVLLSAGVLGQAVSRAVWLGLAVSLAGMLMVSHDALAWGRAPPWAYALPLAGMLALAVATLWQRRIDRGPALPLAAKLWLQCAAACPAFAILAGWQGSLLPQPTAGFVLSVAWTAGLSTLGGYGLYWLCLQRGSATRVSTVLTLSPSVTLLWAWAMFGEPLSWLMALGTAVCMVGVCRVARAQARPA
ncbi:DMT family transporter [Orrella sp. JC864]|uniref:DMT family transporter n=1 Tax=Orrella sp. JC864 TaxID=3120298 RepID=UPI003008C636